MLVDNLKLDLATAMKAGDTVKRDTLRFLLSAVNNVAIAKYGTDAEKKLTESDILDTIKKQVKTHKESIDAFEKGGRMDLVQKEKNELVILETYMPKQMSDEELKKILEPVIATGEKNFGVLMKQAMAAVKGLPAQAGQADGSRVAAMLKQLV